MTNHLRILGLWGAAALALGPTLFELASSLSSVDGTPWFLVAPILIALSLRRASPRAPDRPLLGLMMVVSALVLQLVGRAIDIDSLARTSIPLTVVGLSIAKGWPRIRVALLACWALPPPTFGLTASSPWLEGEIARAATWLVLSLGVRAHAEGPLIVTKHGALQLTAFDGGIPAALLCTELAWYAAIRIDWSRAHTAGALAMAVLIAPVLQAVAIAIAIVLTDHERLAAGQFFHRYGFLGSLALVSVILIELAARQRAAVTAGRSNG